MIKENWKKICVEISYSKKEHLKVKLTMTRFKVDNDFLNKIVLTGIA